MYYLKYYYSHKQDISDTSRSKLKKNNIKVSEKETTTTTKNPLLQVLPTQEAPRVSHLYFLPDIHVNAGFANIYTRSWNKRRENLFILFSGRVAQREQKSFGWTHKYAS